MKLKKLELMAAYINFAMIVFLSGALMLRISVLYARKSSILFTIKMSWVKSLRLELKIRVKDKI